MNGPSDRSRIQIIFDLDGTLFKTETATVPAVIETFKRFGLTKPSKQEICRFFGRPGSEFHTWLESLCPRDMASDFVRDVDRRELEYAATQGELYPGVIRMLTELAQDGYNLALCTNGEAEYVNTVLDAHDLRPFFTAVRHRIHRGDSKPSMVAELLAGGNPAAAVMVGDRDDDIRAARENRIYSIAAAYGYGSGSAFACADAVADAPGDIPGLVKDLEINQ
jgi:phosphoglycolate phosphatase